MKASIIKIGNSQGIRIPKKLLEALDLQGEVELSIKDNGLMIRSANTVIIDEGVLLSYSALSKEWDTPEEDAAWASLQ